MVVLVTDIKTCSFKNQSIRPPAYRSIDGGELCVTTIQGRALARYAVLP
jgi:hypothetical protein